MGSDIPMALNLERLPIDYCGVRGGQGRAGVEVGSCVVYSGWLLAICVCFLVVCVVY